MRLIGCIVWTVVDMLVCGRQTAQKPVLGLLSCPSSLIRIRLGAEDSLRHFHKEDGMPAAEEDKCCSPAAVNGNKWGRGASAAKITSL